MERIQIYKKQKGLEIYVKIFGLLFILFGMTFLIKSLMNGDKTDFNQGDWNYLFYIIQVIQGAALFALGYSNKKNEKLFIEWDEKEMRYLLSKNKTIEKIKFEDIRKVTIQLYEIKIELPSTEKVLNLKNIQYNELKKIKEKFEELKLDLEKRNG
ncbi:MAG: hypothetical protein WBJ36_07780 [Tenuifilum sp.]|uniref:hypothetical protein n=1 Tax=Tenuifilum sp. TaxID=2760880 RepID=UPI001B5A42DA|nr:hypothetical protein [Bacteroidales bacterium]HOK61260.1 hypothetical protein [Tenuifilum sp.]MBP9029290.1 hypothetical protein [Bacteroidales bacterium]HOU74026.1 hypothetical protein [Tenuifilum sp.]HQE54839.1 hypothetical protein [Tenuifilum sp.]